MNLTELQLTAFIGSLVMFGIYTIFHIRQKRIKKSADDSVDRWNARVQKEWNKKGQTVCKHGNPIHERCDICEGL